MHTLSELFEQLGLPCDGVSIDRFIEQHGPIDKSKLLASASFWKEPQRAFLREKIEEDADWSSAIDELNTRLH